MLEGRKNSEVWNYFTESDNRNGLCKLCNRLISFKTTISNLKSHIRRVHPAEYAGSFLSNSAFGRNEHSVEASYEQQPSPSDSLQSQSESDQQPHIVLTTSASIDDIVHSLTNTSAGIAGVKRKQEETVSFNPQKIRPDEKEKIDNSLMNLFTKDFQPFSIVEDEGFQEFVHTLNPSYNLPPRKFVSKTILQIQFQDCLNKTKEYVEKEAKFVCITTDCWSSRISESFIAVTIHFLTDNFQFKSVLLDCALMVGSQSSLDISNEIFQILQEWKLNDKVVLGVSDNDSNILNAFTKFLRFEHLSCYGETLNLLVCEALNPFDILVAKIKNIVFHFKKNTKSAEALIQHQVKNNILQPKKLIQSVPNRWNSVYYMLKRFVELEENLRATVAIIDTGLPVITGEDLEACSQLCDILEPLDEVTQAISDKNYLPGSMPIVLTKALLIVCEQLENQPFSSLPKLVIKNLSCGLKEKFGSLEENEKLAMCTFLDPRFKHHYFTEKTAEAIKSKVRELLMAEIEFTASIKEEESEDKAENSLVRKVPSTLKKNKNISIWKAFDSVVETKKLTKNASTKAEKELEAYLETDLLDRKGCPTEWWKEHKIYFPYLSRIYLSKCGIVASSLSCQRIFSNTGNIISDRRCSFNSAKVRKLVFINANSSLTLQ